MRKGVIGGGTFSECSFADQARCFPRVPLPQPVIPQSTRSSSIGPLERRDDESRGFQREHLAARLAGLLTAAGLLGLMHFEYNTRWRFRCASRSFPSAPFASTGPHTIPT